ncbi:MAG: DNA helicase RecQ [Elusimicrobia bacterium]|nr:DNA helicase RecQ [Elusimicrobiota bacterium]
MNLAAELKQRWGYDQFRPLQREAIEAVTSGQDSLVVLPTGGGKSLCYQLPAVLGKGVVLVVSPLIALMDDQVAAAREAGLEADALHSNLLSAQKSEAYRRLASGKTQILYVSPERLLVGDLCEDLAPRLLLAAVDEAHCVSHWGHEFRPEYRRLAEVLERVPKAVRMALTATATEAVRDDIAAQIPLRDPVRLVGHPDRPNLVYRAHPRRDQAAQVLEVVRRHPEEGGIVYAQTRKDVERLAEGLRKAGVSAAPYHAGLDAETRQRAQEGFVKERIDVVVATIAFGMGIDRSNVRYVVHANTPRSVEHYQQESGRAGRDGLPADCVLLFSAADLATHRWLAQKDGSLPPERQKALERQLREIGRFAVAPVCRHRLLTEHFGAPYQGTDCGACDVCLGETKSLSDADALVTAQKVLSAAWRTNGRFGAGYVVNVLMGKSDERMTRNGHDALQVFGLLKEAGEPAIRSWIDQLIVQGHLEVFDDGVYPLLRVTEAGKALCRGEGGVRLGVPMPPKKPGRRPKALKGRAAGAGDADEALFERLRRLRKMIADQLGAPPYLVFHDSALVEMAALKPKSLDAMRGVKGVGEKKLERFGAAFLAVINGAEPSGLLT